MGPHEGVLLGRVLKWKIVLPVAVPKRLMPCSRFWPASSAGKGEGEEVTTAKVFPSGEKLKELLHPPVRDARSAPDSAFNKMANRLLFNNATVKQSGETTYSNPYASSNRRDATSFSVCTSQTFS